MITRNYRFPELTERSTGYYVFAAYASYIAVFTLITALHIPVRFVFAYSPRHIVLELSSFNSESLPFVCERDNARDSSR